MSCNAYQKIASASAPDGIPPEYRLIDELEGLDKMPFDFTLKNIKFTKKGIIYDEDFSKYTELWGECQLCDQTWLLLSYKLRSIIEENLKGGEGIRWISCNINHGDETRVYYTPFFTKRVDVLDLDKCDYGNREHTMENLIKPVFDFSKASLYAMFSLPRFSNFWKMPSGAYVSEDMKKKITKVGIKGLCFEQCAVSYTNKTNSIFHKYWNKLGIKF